MAEFRRRILAGELVVGSFISLGSPLVTELVSRTLDFVVLDLEHGVLDETTVLAHLYAANGNGKPAIIRPQEATRLRLGRALDFGADGVLIPRVDTAQEVEDVVSWIAYPPDGVRGLALLTRGARLGDVPHAQIGSLNEDPLLVIQVETALAVENVDAMAAHSRVDVLFVGPTDLSHSLGVPGRFGELVFREAVEAVLNAAKRANKVAGVFLRDVGQLDEALDQGFRFVVIGSDASFVAEGARRVSKRVADRRRSG